MRFSVSLGYRALAELARGAAVVAPNTESKFLRALAARRGIRARYREWGAKHRDRSRPLLWMHAPSVGEGLQARPILELARSDDQDVNDRAIDVQVYRLRRFIEDDPSNPAYIQTVWGAGYVFVPDGVQRTKSRELV